MKKSLLICSLFLISCSTTKVPDLIHGSLSIYQPSVLILEKDAKIQTRDGIYTVQEEEIWHSDKRYRELERKSY